MIDRLVTGRRDPLPLTQQLSGCLPDTSASWEVQMLNVAVKWGVFWVESNESYSLRLRCKKVQKRARKKKKSEAQIQYFGWKPAPCRFNRVVNWKMEQRDVWEGVGRVAKGWVPLHGSGTVGEASHSAASSLTCPRVRAKASMSRPYQLISKPMEAFPPTVHSHSLCRETGLFLLSFIPCSRRQIFSLPSHPLRPSSSRTRHLSNKGEEKPVTFATEKPTCLQIKSRTS